MQENKEDSKCENLDYSTNSVIYKCVKIMTGMYFSVIC